MKEFKGTKGEWSVCHLTNGILTDNGLWYEYFHVRKVKEGELLANSKLIAAAPELLEACQQAIRIVDLWAPSYNEKQIKESDVGELSALSMMRMALEKAIEKALN